MYQSLGRVTLNEETHQYFDSDGVEFKSVSKLLASVKRPFDREGISRMMAKSIAEETGVSIESAQEDLLNEWDYKRDNSIDIGHHIHSGIEKYLLEGICDSDVLPIAKKILNYCKRYYRYFPELPVYIEKYKIAGTIDLPALRSRHKASPFDVIDFKTNAEKGIYFESAKYTDTGQIQKYYNRFLLDPLSHLEDCNYNIYSMQLSLYAYMLSQLTGRPVGSLKIIFIDYRTMIPTIIPVPYLKYEAIQLLERNSNLKQLPEVKNNMQEVKSLAKSSNDTWDE